MNTMDIFAGEKVYGENSWNEVDRRGFNQKEISQIRKAECKQGDYNLTCCFFMKSGGQVYFDFTKEYQDKVHIGDEFTLEQLDIVILSNGQRTIKRVEPKH